MADLLKNVQLKRKGSDGTVDVSGELKGKVVALYFSAHWCPPCRAFTPVLKYFYDEIKAENEFEIVFVSFDRSEKDLASYLEEAHGNWLYVPYGNEQIQKLAAKFNVSGIPALIVIKSDGTVINANARSDVQTKPSKVVFSEWKAGL